MAYQFLAYTENRIVPGYAENSIKLLKGGVVSFLDEVKDSTPDRYKCGVAEWLTTQTDLDDRELRAAAEATTIAAVWRAMKNRGYVKQAQTLERHVGGVCSCRS